MAGRGNVVNSPVRGKSGPGGNLASPWGREQRRYRLATRRRSARRNTPDFVRLFRPTQRLDVDQGSAAGRTSVSRSKRERDLRGTSSFGAWADGGRSDE